MSPGLLLDEFIAPEIKKLEINKVAIEIVDKDAFDFIHI